MKHFRYYILPRLLLVLSMIGKPGDQIMLRIELEEEVPAA